MSSARLSGVATRSLRNAQRGQRTLRPRIQRRTYADVPTPNTQAGAAGSGALAGGLIGGGTVLVAAYGYYHFSGAKTAVQTMKSAENHFKLAKNKIIEQTPEPNEAIEWLHRTAVSYAGFIPGAQGYIDTAFKDIESVRAKHRDEVDTIIREGYDELRDITKNGDMSFATAASVWNVLQDKLKKIGELAGEAVEDILNNHPEVKEKVGGNIDQLKQLQDQYGPKVKDEVDKTWHQIREVVQKGVSASTAADIQKIVKEKIALIKELGDKAYNEGLEKVKPYLEKSPKVKQLVEENADALKQGNLNELWSKIKSAVDSGDTKDFEEFIKKNTDKAKKQGQKFGVDVEKYLGSIPGSAEIFQKIQQLQEIGQKRSPEAKKIFDKTVEEIKQVLQKRTQEAEELAKKAKKDQE